MQNREIFLHHGGEKFSHVPCLNNSAGRHAGHHCDGAARAFGLALTPGVLTGAAGGPVQSVNRI